MTDNEIIKALECCGGSEGCDLCPLKGKSLGCVAILLEHAFALINRQKAEIERLNNKFTNLMSKLKGLVGDGNG